MQASLKTASYNQIMSLSRDFHTEKQSGELFKSIDQGRSITSLLDTLLFRTGPMLIDIVVAFSYLCVHALKMLSMSETAIVAD